MKVLVLLKQVLMRPFLYLEGVKLQIKACCYLT